MTKTKINHKVKTRSSIENCRVLDIGIDKMGECLKPGPCSCSYAVPFGYCFLCNHPRLSEIIENTRRAQPAAVLIR
jgi:hypothetical protein